jgi:hypothetical protein
MDQWNIIHWTPEISIVEKRCGSEGPNLDIDDDDDDDDADNDLIICC